MIGLRHSVSCYRPTDAVDAEGRMIDTLGSPVWIKQGALQEYTSSEQIGTGSTDNSAGAFCTLPPRTDVKLGDWLQVTDVSLGVQRLYRVAGVRPTALTVRATLQLEG